MSTQKRVAVRVTPDALRHVRAGHPWVFDKSITSVSHDGAAGDLAVIFDDDRRFAAIGLYDPHSPIRVRVLHQGKPLNIDEGFWTGRLRNAIERRNAVTSGGDTTGYRVVHGENDGMSGLVLDRYGDAFVMKLYTTAWLPHLDALVPVIEQLLHPASLIVRFSRDVARADLRGLSESDALIGTPPTEPVLFREHGLTFEADVVRGQKTGHFLDQRDNRQRVRAYSKGARVLDVFACTGGFSVFAAAGGAASVQSVDLADAALETAKRNMAHNSFIGNVQRCEHTTTTGDAFDVMKALVERKRHFELVIVDPPSFARKALDHDRAMHAYRRLTKLAVELVEPGGVLVQSSCSSRVGADEFYDNIHDAAGSQHRLTEMLRTGHAADHPVGFPEGAYLKTIFARVG